MKCSNCGQECADTLRFCTNCGIELSEQKDTTEEVATVEAVQSTVADENKTEVIKIDQIEIEEMREKKTRAEKKAEKEEKKAYKDGEKNLSRFLKPGLAGLCVLVLFAIILKVAVFREKPYEKLSEKAILEFYEEKDRNYICFHNGEKLQLDDEHLLNPVYSMDKTVLCYVNEHNEFMVIKDGELRKTGIEDVSGVKVSDGGDTIAYFTQKTNSVYKAAFGFEDTIETGTLSLYYIDKNKSDEIATDVVIGSATLSPDGETVAYVTEYEATDDFRGYYSVKGRKPVEVGKEKRVFAISDKAKHVYYMDVDRIYVQKKGKEEEKLASGLRSVEALLNKDYTELLYLSDGKTYVSVDGGEKKKVSGTTLSTVLFPESAAYANSKMEAESGTITVSYTGVDTFKEKVLYSDSDRAVYFMSDAYEDEMLASDIRLNDASYALSDDYESLVYLHNTDVVLVTDFEKGGVKKDLDDEANARELYADGKLKYVYYVNAEKELYCLKGRKAKKIADDVTSVCISEDGKYCYYVVEKEKYCYSKKGRKGKELLKEDGTVVVCYRVEDAVYTEVRESKTVDVYRMDGKEMGSYRSYDKTDIEAYLKEKYHLDDPLPFWD